MLIDNNLKTVDFSKFDKNTWSNISAVTDIVRRVKKASKIILPSGEEVSRKEWKTGYEDCLNWQCQSSKKTEIIFDAYTKIFKDYPEGFKKDDIRHFIKNNVWFLGTKHAFDFSDTSIEYLANPEFCALFERFQERVSEKLKQFYDQQKCIGQAHKKSVAVLTCNAGGGHRMVAKSIEDHLKKDQTYDVKVINIDELSGDSLDVVTAGAVKTYQLFAQFRCQENNDEKADLFYDLRWELHQFLQSNLLDEVNKKILECNASCVFNTIHHEPNYISSLSDLGVPVCFINTDYVLPSQLTDINSRFKNDHFSVATPVDYQSKEKNVSAVGYPIRSGFEVQATEEQKMNLRQKYNIRDDESLIVIQMGSLAMGIDQEIESLIQKTKNLKKKCHFVFLCANNQLAKNAVMRGQNSKKNRMITLHAEGMLNDQELSVLYQASEAVLGKPGGATTAEIAATGTFLLAYKPLPWETDNLKYLQKRNQGKEIGSFADIQDFLEKLKRNPVDKKPEVIDWKKNILNHIHTMTNNENKTIAGRVVRPYSDGVLAILGRRIGYIWNMIQDIFSSGMNDLARMAKKVYRFVVKQFDKIQKYELVAY